MRDECLPGRFPRPELSKNCLGQVLISISELSPTPKNLLFGESWQEDFGESRTFLGDWRTFFGVTRNFLGELKKLAESEVTARPLLVGVEGDDGLVASIFGFPFNLMALPFHLLTSAA